MQADTQDVFQIQWTEHFWWSPALSRQKPGLDAIVKLHKTELLNDELDFNWNVTLRPEKESLFGCCCSLKCVTLSKGFADETEKNAVYRHLVAF